VKDYILHIGLPKTGTTAIQTQYFGRLPQSSICYNPPSIVGSLIQALKLLDFNILKEADLQLLNDVIRWQENRIRQQKILISLENLSQRLGRFNFVDRGNFLKALFPDAAIVLTVRYQPALLRSLYLQFLKQNYFLTPEEVFVPFANREFSEAEQWKASMQIDIMEWDYKETVKYFREIYGEKFHVFFYETFSSSLVGIGQAVLNLAGCHIDDGISHSLPKTNVSYDSFTANLILAIVRKNLAFRANRGFDSRYMQDLMDQATQARFQFDAANVTEFASRMHQSKYVLRITHTGLDRQLIRIIRAIGRTLERCQSRSYELPEPIKTYLESQAKTMNASLHEIIDRRTIPKQYM